MKLQEIFDIVSAHLQKMKKQSYLDDMCVYSDNKGNMCAVGVLLSHCRLKKADLKSAYLYLGGVSKLINDAGLKFPKWFTKSEQFLRDLQNVHDLDANWDITKGFVGQTDLRRIADYYNLTYKE